MREFQIPFTKQLLKGLSAFPTGLSSSPQLSACYNLMPVEGGLNAHETIYGIGLAKSAFNYLEIKDQVRVSWYWYPVFDGHILVGGNIPSEPSTGYDVTPITPLVVPYWVEILDQALVTWYLYPDQSNGFTRARDTAPAIGTGMKNLIWRGTTGELWQIRYNSVLNTRHAVKV